MGNFVISHIFDTNKKRLVCWVYVANPNSPNNFIKAVGLWDTGASTSCISKSLVEKLNLDVIKTETVVYAISEKITNIYLINFKFNDEHIFENLKMYETDGIKTEHIDILIGMDIISQGDFIINNYNNKTQYTFLFPSREHIVINNKTNVPSDNYNN